MTSAIDDLSASALGHDRVALLELLRERSFERRRVVLASGRESDFYIDCKKTDLTAEGHWLVGRLLLARIPDGVTGVGGLTLGADPIASAVSLVSHAAGRPVDAFIVRKEPKGHGTEVWIEHTGLEAHAEVVIIEDVVTTGGSALKAIERVRKHGWKVVKVLALVDRQEGGREAIQAAGVSVEALFTRADFMEAE